MVPNSIIQLKTTNNSMKQKCNWIDLRPKLKLHNSGTCISIIHEWQFENERSIRLFSSISITYTSAMLWTQISHVHNYLPCHAAGLPIAWWLLLKFYGAEVAMNCDAGAASCPVAGTELLRGYRLRNHAYQVWRSQRWIIQAIGGNESVLSGLAFSAIFWHIFWTL